MANFVNMDALVTREDFEVVSETTNVVKIERLPIRDLETGFFYNALRKPDFQRETANWAPTKVLDLIRTFIDGDLIPAVILWQSGKDVFVIDGAHRLSALIAWVQDDYGDGKRSLEFFRNQIPEEQIKVAERARSLIKGELGSYAEHIAAGHFPDNSSPEMRERAKRLGFQALPVQWVPAGNAKKAEEAFFKINQAATEIDPTELRILRARKSPNALAARVTVRNATGHRYWSTFSPSLQEETEKLGREIFSVLFNPPLDTPIKTLDLPVAGRSGQALPLVFELVNVANDVPVVDASKGKKTTPIGNDDDGNLTLTYLKRTRDLVGRISGTNPASLGLHPAVYFYSTTGRHNPTAVLAVSAFVKWLVANNFLKQFTKVRREFEEFFLRNKNFVNQIVTKRGSGAKGYDWVEELYRLVFTEMRDGRTGQDMLDILKRHSKFSLLSTITFDASNGDGRPGAKFTRNNKSAAFLKEALEGALRCSICGARMHKNSIQIDHEVPRREGGSGTIENAKLAHPYCNSTVKS
jgi:hypothetical protein